MARLSLASGTRALSITVSWSAINKDDARKLLLDSLLMVSLLWMRTDADSVKVPVHVPKQGSPPNLEARRPGPGLAQLLGRVYLPNPV